MATGTLDCQSRVDLRLCQKDLRASINNYSSSTMLELRFALI